MMLHGCAIVIALCAVGTILGPQERRLELVIIASALMICIAIERLRLAVIAQQGEKG